MRYFFKIGILVSFLLFSGCNESTTNNEDNTIVDPYAENSNYSIYVEYAEANNQDISACVQDQISSLCGYKGDTSSIPQMPCENTETCLDNNRAVGDNDNKTIATYQDYVDYAEANNRDVSKCEQDINCNYCGFVGNSSECEYPPTFCTNTETCQ